MAEVAAYRGLEAMSLEASLPCYPYLWLPIPEESRTLFDVAPELVQVPIDDMLKPELRAPFFRSLPLRNLESSPKDS